jgi:prefoldin subunit
MLAYPIDEAESMLTEKLRAAEASLSNCEEDLEFLREQITVSNILASMH